MKIIQTKNAPKAVGPYSQAILSDNTLYISGQIPFEPSKMELVGPTIQEQTHQCLQNINAILTEANMSKTDVVKCSVFLTDLSMFSQMNNVYETFFENHKPARFAVEVSRLPKDVLIEIDAIAVKEK